MDAMKFDEKLSKLCRDKGLKQSDVVRAVGDVSKETVSRWFGGKATPDIHEGVRIARLVGVSLDFLADDSLDEPADMTEAEAAFLALIRERGEKLFILKEGMDAKEHLVDLRIRYLELLASSYMQDPSSTTSFAGKRSPPTSTPSPKAG